LAAEPRRALVELDALEHDLVAVCCTAPLVPSAAASHTSELELSNACWWNAIVPDCTAAVDGTASAATAIRQMSQRILASLGVTYTA